MNTKIIRTLFSFYMLIQTRNWTRTFCIIPSIPLNVDIWKIHFWINTLRFTYWYIFEWKSHNRFLSWRKIGKSRFSRLRQFSEKIWKQLLKKFFNVPFANKKSHLILHLPQCKSVKAAGKPSGRGFDISPWVLKCLWLV